MDENFAQPNFAKFNENLRQSVRKNSDFSALSNSFDELFSQYFKELNLEGNFANIAKTCTSEFKNGVLKLFESKQEALNLRASELLATLKSSDDSAIENEAKAKLTKEKITALNALIKRIEQC